MIIKASQRANGGELAVHLLNAQDNEHITLHDMRGFISDDLKDAFDEIRALSKLTKCKQYLFSVSLNPPRDADVCIADFEAAAARMEQRLGLSEQPRAMLFHEKDGRLHAHCVWSRIDVDNLKAVHLPFFKTRLMELARELYLEHGWTMPAGLDGFTADPTNYDLAEAQQAKRAERDPKELKAFFQSCWQRSDGPSSFAAALNEGGLALAKGDRRGFVAVDGQGEVYSLSRWCGVKSKELKERLGDPTQYPAVDEAIEHLRAQEAEREKETETRHKAELRRALSRIHTRRQKMVARHRQERAYLLQQQKEQEISEARQRATELNSGLKGLWQWVTGARARIRKRHLAEAERSTQRDRESLMQQSATRRRERRAVMRETELQKKHLRRALERNTEPSLARVSNRNHEPLLQ